MAGGKYYKKILNRHLRTMLVLVFMTFKSQ
jgi:hypothetical protein